ncbi:MAG: iron-containing alcohol dehydrogenase [Pseudotabrizicola sp.]|uniref:iron-containing alcohol dehydrogenase n=1 Tax=Pseudotabrizicola sp. TaxID=2939647 RepID=UPI0027318342|nr:iron-containing alcohol dehydrogenase [Pseudotabrizicola sp.]MDP2081929.1 iron-containing alcohol dehydrogenase [Pseudotabrizicola sp.]MDZ7576001.1 iron-containing alcohol dehydrogenase [Pseudotabrizicola sp.]
MSFTILQPSRILFGRGLAAQAVGLARGFGPRGVVVHGANPARVAAVLGALGPDTLALCCAREPTLAMLEAALSTVRPFHPDWVLAIGGGAVLDFGKALAAMIPAPGELMDHLEIVGKGLPLAAAPLPFLALPTTAGTGAEVTKNAVIGLPDHGRKVSLRDDRMIARVAIIDPALTDGCPWPVTLASGLDAVTQVIEPYVSVKATPYTDAISLPAIAPGLRALMRLQYGEDTSARDALAWTSLCGGLALANAGLGVVHGFASVIGGTTGAAHGAICGALLGPVLAMNRARATDQARARLEQVCAILAEVLDCPNEQAPAALSSWAHGAGLARLSSLGVAASDHAALATAAQSASSSRGNPVALSNLDLCTILEQAG